MKYQTKVTVPDDIKSYFEPFLGQGDVAFDNDWNLRFTFDAEDLWEAHELVSGVAREADATYGRVGGQTDFTRAIAVGDPAQVKLSNSVAELSDEPRTERVYLTAEAAQAARAEEELEELERSTRAYLTPAAAERAAGRQEVDAIVLAGSNGSRGVDPAPGQGATLFVGSDRYPYTIRDIQHFKTGSRKGQPRYVWASLDDVVNEGGTQVYAPRADRAADQFLATSIPGMFKSDHATLRVGKRAYYQAPEV